MHITFIFAFISFGLTDLCHRMCRAHTFLFETKSLTFQTLPNRYIWLGQGIET